MRENLPDDWSPADNPYAIAVSEAGWLRSTVALTVHRMHSDDGPVGWFSSRQIDARTLVVALRQLLAAVKLEQIALTDLNMDPAVGEALGEAQKRFEAALPNIKHVRDGLTHFEDWARGEGRSGPQGVARKAGSLPRDVARDFWSFGYDPVTDTVTMGPFTISVSAALPATDELVDAIYAAARAVDRRSTTEIRSLTVQALTDAAIPCEAPQGPVLVSPGNDGRIRVSFNLGTASEVERTELATKVLNALAGAGLRLTSESFPQAEDMADRLVVGEILRIERT